MIVLRCECNRILDRLSPYSRKAPMISFPHDTKPSVKRDKYAHAPDVSGLRFRRVSYVCHPRCGRRYVLRIETLTVAVVRALGANRTEITAGLDTNDVRPASSYRREMAHPIDAVG